MKVLWFINTYGNSRIAKSNSKGGWINSLESSFSEDTNIDLAIAFLHDTSYYKKSKNLTYYGIQLKYNSKLKRLYQRYFSKLSNSVQIEKLVKVVDDFNPDIIHIHGTESPFGLVINKVKIPAVISIQGNITVIAKKYFSGISLKNIKQRTPLLNYLFKTDIITKYKIFKKQSTREKKILYLSKHIIGRTDWDRRIMKILAPKAKYFYGGEILRDVFYRNKWQDPIESRKISIISIIGVGAYKGLETILQSAKLLSENNIDFIWNIAGISNTDQILRIVELHQKTTLNKYNIQLLGSLNEDALIKEMLKCNIFVSPSHIENSPNNVCEAMIIGMPIIATFAGGTGSLLNDKKEGILIQDGDPWAMAGAIIELAEDRYTAVEYGNLARKRALMRHNHKQIVKGYISIYKEIIG